MSKPTRTICLDIDVEDGPPHGRVAELGGASREFAGWLGLLTVLGHLLDEPTAGTESSAPPAADPR